MINIQNNPVLQWISIIIIGLIVVFFYVSYSNSWSKTRAGDKVELFGGWSEPVRLGINTNNSETDAYISSDGNSVYYTYQSNNDKTDIYYSLKPFSRSKKHAISEDDWSESGAMFAGSNIYYASDRNSPDVNNLYKNGQRLIMSDSRLDERDPYYCSSLDELYFVVDDRIYMSIGDEVSVLPVPINDGGINIQPFLTVDCQTMYFASSRGEGDMLKIYRSNRHEKGWQKPELVARSKYGVSHPTLTDNSQMLFFVQTFQSPRDETNADIFYVEMVK